MFYEFVFNLEFKRIFKIIYYLVLSFHTKIHLNNMEENLKNCKLRHRTLNVCPNKK